MSTPLTNEQFWDVVLHEKFLHVHADRTAYSNTYRFISAALSQRRMQAQKCGTEDCYKLSVKDAIKLWWREESA